MFRYGIEVIGHSSDGDPRLFSAMNNKIKLDVIPHIDVLNSIQDRLNLSPYSSCVQDMIHIGTKLRNRLLNPSVVLHIGDKVVSALHLKMLINTVPKETHGLVLHDIYTEDRQNFKSLEKVMEPRVLEALEKNIVDSQATVMYLTLCKHITASYLQKNILPIDRIYNIWYSVYFLRCWRKWIQSKHGFTLGANFITSNAYGCVELNAQSLIELIVKLRTVQMQTMFLPSYFSSQPCEEFFRHMRSMGTMNFTKINFSIYDLTHMVSRVEMMYKIICSRKEIVSPRMTLDTEVNEAINFPSDDEIISTLIDARNDALQKALEFGINSTAEDIMTCGLQRNISQNKKGSHECADLLLSEIDSDFSMDSSSDTSSIDIEEKIDKNQSIQESVDENPINIDAKTGAKYIETIDSDGEKKNMKVTTLIWSLEESNKKLSSDRLKRVKQPDDSDKQQSKRRKVGESSTSANNDKVYSFKSDILSISDWAIFKNDMNNPNDIYLIGIVVGFRFVAETVNEHTQRKRKKITKYRFDYASTKNEAGNQAKKKKIQVLCMWYNINENGLLNARQNSENLIVYMESYLATMKTPKVENNNETKDVFYVLSPDQLNELKGLATM